MAPRTGDRSRTTFSRAQRGRASRPTIARPLVRARSPDTARPCRVKTTRQQKRTQQTSRHPAEMPPRECARGRRQSSAGMRAGAGPVRAEGRRSPRPLEAFRNSRRLAKPIGIGRCESAPIRQPRSLYPLTRRQRAHSEPNRRSSRIGARCERPLVAKKRLIFCLFFCLISALHQIQEEGGAVNQRGVGSPANLAERTARPSAAPAGSEGPMRRPLREAQRRHKLLLMPPPWAGGGAPPGRI